MSLEIAQSSAQAVAQAACGESNARLHKLSLLTRGRLQEALVRASEACKEREELRAEVTELGQALREAKTIRDTAVKERDQALAQRDNLLKEKNTLKQTLSAHAIRIAELEAQLVDKTERQKQIDEEMAKVEGQMEMLKELLRPALT